MSGPLSGIRVVELAGDLCGAFAGQILADEGAEVIKIEPPTGDPLRHDEAYADAESRRFQALNRNKRSVVLDLTDPDGAGLLQRLLATADVLVTTLPAAELARLDLEEAALQARAPNLIPVYVSALGDQGPWAQAPMSPLCLQAIGGIMASEGMTAADGTPLPVRSTDMIERSSGLFAALGASAALFARRRTGRARTVRLSKLAAAIYLQGSRTGNVPAADDKVRNPARRAMAELRAAGASYAAVAEARARIVVVPAAVFYRAYNTRDGAIFIGALSAPLRARARRAMETDFLHRDDPNWNPDDPAYLAFCAEQQAAIEAHMLTRTTAEWVARCDAENVPAGEVVFPEDLADNEQARANELLVWVDHPSAGRQLQAAPFSRFRRHPRPVLNGAPALGQDTTEYTS